jgi:VIT1/CCC1 family predicted Fe2+/Mn2+ transporter
LSEFRADFSSLTITTRLQSVSNKLGKRLFQGFVSFTGACITGQALIINQTQW